MGSGIWFHGPSKAENRQGLVCIGCHILWSQRYVEKMAVKPTVQAVFRKNANLHSIRTNGLLKTSMTEENWGRNRRSPGLMYLWDTEVGRSHTFLSMSKMTPPTQCHIFKKGLLAFDMFVHLNKCARLSCKISVSVQFRIPQWLKWCWLTDICTEGNFTNPCIPQNLWHYITISMSHSEKWLLFRGCSKRISLLAQLQI